MEAVEYKFLELMGRCAMCSEEKLFEMLLKNYNGASEEVRNRMKNHWRLFPFWGGFQPENGWYGVFRNRARMIKKHMDDLLWLFVRLEDARSKNVLFAILSNWVDMEGESLALYRERKYPSYYDLEIFPKRQGEVFVDMGAFTGDSAKDFIDSYGTDYSKIYCYDITPDTFAKMQENLQHYPRIECRQKGVGAEPGQLFLTQHSGYPSASQVTSTGEQAVDIVRIDDDVPERVTFLKMDIEGAEQDALRGCVRQIRENHPRLAICTYHGHEDLVMVPRIIDEINPNYKFYMRYNGGTVFATEFVLLAV
jgi:FkbM family methyltransferase